MGVSFTDSYEVNNKNKQYSDIKNIKLNANYRNDEVYQECSYQTPTLKSLKNVKDVSDLVGVHNNIHHKTNMEQSWSKVYKSPPPKRHSPQLEVGVNVINSLSNLNNLTEIEYKRTKINEVAVSPRTSMTCVKTTDNDRVQKSRWNKITFPKFVCPCCTGGDDDVENLNNQRPTTSYESIDLKVGSDSEMFSINLDPSLMSIIRLQKHLKARRTPNTCGKLVKVLLQNTFKNIITSIRKI